MKRPFLPPSSFVPLILLACGAASGADRAWTQWRNTLSPRGESGPELVLARDGQTDYAILAPAAATAQDRVAASELAHWLKEMTGATFPIVASR